MTGQYRQPGEAPSTSKHFSQTEYSRGPWVDFVQLRRLPVPQRLSGFMRLTKHGTGRDSCWATITGDWISLDLVESASIPEIKTVNGESLNSMSRRASPADLASHDIALERA